MFRRLMRSFLSGNLTVQCAKELHFKFWAMLDTVCVCVCVYYSFLPHLGFDEMTPFPQLWERRVSHYSVCMCVYVCVRARARPQGMASFSPQGREANTSLPQRMRIVFLRLYLGLDMLLFSLTKRW